MKSLTLLWKSIAEESAIRCRTSTTMDYKTVQGRSKHEGLSFFTITLPSFGSDFQKSLDQGLVDRNSFQGFSWRAGLPQFLGGFLDLVFDRTSGVLLNEPDVDAILAIRQLTLIFSKIQLPCSDAREKDAMSGYIECEEEVKVNDSLLDPLDYKEFERMSQLLFRDIFSVIDRKVYYNELIPKHGPGATADKLRGNSKYRNRTWTDRLEPYFPAMDYMFPSPSYYWEEIDDVHHLDPGSEIPVKVISVPKTMKTPRIIAIEPTHMQYVQQALLQEFVDQVENSFLSEFIGFESQEPNQLLAQESSSDGRLATLDLSEASDRVSNQLVRTMCNRQPHLRGALEACRSRRADVPGHGVIRLAKFASMGSAVCFPVEAMVFMTLCFLGIEQELNTRFTHRSDIIRWMGSVRIYGDDIIVPVDMVHSVISTLEHFGARVGAHKSFWIGRFRESCGKEYYDGIDVSIVKVRRMLPASRRHVPEVISAVSLRNQLYKAGYWQTVKRLDSELGRMLNHFPVVSESSPVLGRHTYLDQYDCDRMCEKLHSPLVKGWVVSSRLPQDNLEGPGALLKGFLKRGNQPIADRKHLERAGRPRAVDIKPGWYSPF